MRSECDRTRLIAELANLLRDCELPEEARHAGLTLIGWLARRMPGETASTVGVEQASRQHLRAVCFGENPTNELQESPIEASGRATPPPSHSARTAVVSCVTSAVIGVRKTP